jgi:hypothetical protein
VHQRLETRRCSSVPAGSRRRASVVCGAQFGARTRFGILLATTLMSRFLGMDGRGAVVNALVVADVRYAVVEALRTEGGSERFVLAYRNERSLRDLIAAPCIAAFGFSSREDATAKTKHSVSMATIQKQTRSTKVVKRIEECEHGRHRAEQRSETCSASSKIRQFLTAFYSDAVVAGILIMFSRNMFSTAIRTFLAV